MSEFSVIPGDLIGYAAQLSRAAEMGKNGSRYIDTWIQLPGWGDGSIIKLFTGNHDKVCNAVRRVVNNVTTLTDTSSKQLILGAKYYTSADQKAAERADAALPNVSIKTTPQIPEKESAIPFQDTVDAEHFLEPPEAPEMSEMSKIINNPATIYEYFSPTNIVIQTLKYFGIPDPVEDFTKAFVGNWEQVHQAGTAISNLGEMVNAVGQNVKHGNVALSQSWTGNAAHAAYNYFDGLSGSLTAQQAAFDRLRDGYHQAALGVWRTAETAGGLIKEIFDDVLIAAIAASAGTGTSETGIGAIVGWGAAAWKVKQIWEKYNRCTILIHQAWNAMNVFVGMVNSTISSADFSTQYPLPNTAYKFPAA